MSVAIIFFFGFIVFGAVISSFIIAVSKSGNRRRIGSDSEEADFVDYDGGGNWGRVPPKKNKK
tara:strand:+ start:238 stop:426 length:189 start_codon:yes stop_codon:yes gene_type:complete